MLADSLVVQTGAGAAEVNVGEDNQSKGQINHGSLVKQQLTDKGNVLQTGNCDALHQLDLVQTTCAEGDAVDEGCQRRGQQIDGHAVDGMVGTQGNGGICVDHIHQNTGHCTAQNAHPGAAGVVSQHKACQSTDSCDTFQTDVDHTSALGPQLRH